MSLVYLDCFAGAAGDMILGGLIDAGAPFEEIEEGLAGLGLHGWRMSHATEMRGPLRASRVRVETRAEATRTVPEIVASIEDSGLPERARARAIRTFTILGTAEVRVHGGAIGEAHLHEAGGLDAIVDVVGSALALEALAADTVVCSPLVSGRGEVESAHGRLPVPAPAVLEICAAHSIPLSTRGGGETLTPTGAAIVAGMADDFGDVPTMKIRAVGYGAGARSDTELPNVVRVLVGESAPDAHGRNDALLIEANLDDMNPEVVPYVIESLLEAGAHDAWAQPITMKKGRIGTKLSALVDPMHRFHAFEILFRETTTLGLRVQSVGREVLERDFVEVDVEGFAVRVKIGRRAEDVVTTSVEYEDAVAAARATGLPLKQVYRLALDAVGTRAT